MCERAVPAALPLTPFEQFMLQEDRPGFPMVFYAHFVFDGAIDGDALQGAADEAVRRHPFIFGHVRRPCGAPHWILDSPRDASVERMSPAERTWPDFPPTLDLTRQPGLRIRYGRFGPQSHLWVQGHHVCADGGGSRQFMSDLFAAYANRTGACPPIAFTKLDWSRLATRGRRQRTHSVAKSTPGRWQRLKNAFDFLTIRPVMIRQASACDAETEVRHHFVQNAFTRDESARVKQCAKANRVTVNDLALTFLFRSLAKACDARITPARRWIRILIPVDMRSYADRHLPAANKVGYSFMWRRIHDCHHTAALLRGVHDEMQYVKQSGVAQDFIDLLGLIVKWPLVPRLAQRYSPSMATATLTNLHDMMGRARHRFPLHDGSMQIGNLVLRKIFAVPPIRFGTQIGAGINDHGGFLTLSMLVDGHRFTREEAERVLAAYRAEWDEWLAAQGAVAPPVVRERAA